MAETDYIQYSLYTKYTETLNSDVIYCAAVPASIGRSTDLACLSVCPSVPYWFNSKLKAQKTKIGVNVFQVIRNQSVC